MRFTVLSLFPEICDAFFSASIMAKAIDRGVVSYRSIDIRDFAVDKHHKCDDAPYGGGAGMLMLPEPIGRCLDSLGVRQHQGVGIDANIDKPALSEARDPNEACPVADSETTQPPRPRVIYLTPSGKLFNQDMAKELAAESELILVCGRYEGLDQRIIDLYVDDEISVGDYVLSSGEIAALVVIDAVYRLVDGVINAESLEEESFGGGLLEYPQYTRPEIYANIRVPEALLSGHHENIRRWRLRRRVEKTLRIRPDLIRSGLAAGTFSAETTKIIKELEEAGYAEMPTGKPRESEGE